MNDFNWNQNFDNLETSYQESKLNEDDLYKFPKGFSPATDKDFMFSGNKDSGLRIAGFN